jgi:hypothetical protein
MEGSTSGLVAYVGNLTGEEMEGRRGGQTVSSRFTVQLKELVAMLDATGLHFVRCIKPNAGLRPGNFDHALVLQQLRCCGVLEVARVSRAGFPTRYLHAEFVRRYKILLPVEQQEVVARDAAGTRQGVRALLAAFRVPQGQFEMGHTKVFFRPGALMVCGVSCSSSNSSITANSSNSSAACSFMRENIPDTSACQCCVNLAPSTSHGGHLTHQSLLLHTMQACWGTWRTHGRRCRRLLCACRRLPACALRVSASLLRATQH